MREHSALQIRQKLARLGYPEPEIAAALAHLQAHERQSDARFAEIRTRGLKQRGAGPRRIRAQLRAAGVETWADRSLLRDDAGWIVEAKRALGKRFGEAAAADRVEWLKRARWLAGRGFTEGQIRSALQARACDDDE